MTEWQQVGQIPIDTGRLVLIDPMNVDDVARHEDDLLDRLEREGETAEPSMNFELVTNEHGVAVALVLQTGLGDGLYPVEARFEEAAGVLRIAEVRVRFLPHPVLSRELPR